MSERQLLIAAWLLMIFAVAGLCAVLFTDYAELIMEWIEKVMP